MEKGLWKPLGKGKERLFQKAEIAFKEPREEHDPLQTGLVFSERECSENGDLSSYQCASAAAWRAGGFAKPAVAAGLPEDPAGSAPLRWGRDTCPGCSSPRCSGQARLQRAPLGCCLATGFRWQRKREATESPGRSRAAGQPRPDPLQIRAPLCRGALFGEKAKPKEVRASAAVRFLFATSDSVRLKGDAGMCRTH